MKKIVSFVLSLALCGAFFAGCGCTNTDVQESSASTEMTRPTTVPTTAPTTMPATAPSTTPTTAPTTESESGTNGENEGIMGTTETAGDNGVVGEDGTGATDMAGARGRRVRPMG